VISYSTLAAAVPPPSTRRPWASRSTSVSTSDGRGRPWRLGGSPRHRHLISEARATVGGLVSRFEFRGQQIVTSLENIEAAKSSIMDVDLAAEQSRLVSSQVLVQASVSALSQANELPQALLRLLQ
jgi:flagellin